MIQRERGARWAVEGFGRYRPENRISRGLVSAAPWVNIALLVAMYLYLTAPQVLQPGIRVQLPQAPFVSGTPYGLNLVILAQDLVGRTSRQEIVYFDDDRFVLDKDLGVLGQRLNRAARERLDVPMVVEADKAVQHGTIIRVLGLASEAGFKEVNLATLPAR